MSDAVPRRERLADALDVAADLIDTSCPACRGDGYVECEVGTTCGVDPYAGPEPVFGTQECGDCCGRGVDLADATHAAACWEALATAGLIPHDAVDDPRRRFLLDLDRQASDRWRGPRGHTAVEMVEVVSGGVFELAHPPTPGAGVALAADWPGVLAAEALAREIVTTMMDRPDRVVWRVVPRTADVWSADGWRVLATRVPAIASIRAAGYVLAQVLRDEIVLIAPAL